MPLPFHYNGEVDTSDLTERFERNRDSYTSGQYNETQLRREFLDPLFDALGWDVNNNSGRLTLKSANTAIPVRNPASSHPRTYLLPRGPLNG
jgi:hypothetical protein